MLDISGNDIALLGDEDLRSLVSLLCEAELRKRSYPTSAVTSGGEQEAPDGGVDVRVALPANTPIEGYVPRAASGFQVKKSDMPRAAILREMRPKGRVRTVIQDLVDRAGAYVIVSSNGSTSDSALHDRRNAMADALKDLNNSNSLHLDFYDRTRIASWLRDHPGLIPWVRQRIGKAIAGWQSYGAWASVSEGIEAEYLIDDKTCVKTGKREDGEGISCREGIKRVRNMLRDPRSVVRLVGLSGVGKTRFVQALFDERLGEMALDPSVVLYTNMNDNPDPQPVGMMSDLIATRAKAVVVVDNCPLELHRRLSDVCRGTESTVSVISVEYDIRDDQPEETQVIRIEPSSVELIEKLVKRRFPTLSIIDARTVAEFSGGNARAAIALANTVEKDETISGLADEDLFERLFQQRHGHDEPLLLAAQACSLVYSFQGEAVSGEEAELPILAALIGRSADEVFRAVAELKRRDLVQQRGVWRAVLPHAIANRLAAMALQNIPLATIETLLVNGTPERLLKSFARRLSYLHNSKEAVLLVEKWLGDGGLLGGVTRLNALGEAMLESVAPVAPGAVLTALEHVSPDSFAGRTRVIRLVRSLAYEPAFFERCTELFAKICATATEENRESEAASCFESLFFLFLSGTHATMVQRLRVIEAQLYSESRVRHQLGLDALSAMLEAWHFSSGFSFEFGARSRDHGYWPRTVGEMQQWFAGPLKLVEAMTALNSSLSNEVRSRLAQKFRGLWTKAGMHDELDRVARSVVRVSFWREGWIAVRQTMRFDAAAMSNEARAQLNSLERVLRPKDLVQKVRSLVLGKSGGAFEFDDIDGDGTEVEELTVHRGDTVAISLGKDTASDEPTFRELLPELVAGQGRLWMFGRGLAQGAEAPEEIWKALVDGFKASAEETRNQQVLCGFIDGLDKREPERANALLDGALVDDVVAAWIPVLQCAVFIDERGVERLKKSLAKNAAPVWRYQCLAMGRASDPIEGAEFKTIVLGIAAKPDGFDVAADILYMRSFSDKQANKVLDPNIIEAGQYLIQSMAFDREHRDDDHKVAAIIASCMTGEDGARIAQAICKRFKESVVKNEAHAYNYNELVQALLKTQPLSVLEALFGGDEQERKVGVKIVEEVSYMHVNPLDAVSQENILRWCEQAPIERYPIIASAVALFQNEGGKSPLEWSEIAQRLLERAPDRLAVLKQFVRRFRPRSWEGSLATAMEAPLPVLRGLEVHSDPQVAEFAKREGERLSRDVDVVRRQETAEDKLADERFE